MRRAAAHPTQLTDEVRDAHVPSVELDAPVTGPEVAPEGDDAEILAWASQRSIGNAVLRNGARWYVDHAHPEYSAPEVLRAREAVVVDRAGEEIARRAMGTLAGAEGIPEVALYKNNTDGKGASYGTHENYLVDRDVPFERIVEALLPFFATRQVLVGAGRVGIGTRGETPGFQLSSRADFMEAEVGLETTLNRPIVNTRDEPHSDPGRFRRLHVIIGDANLLEESTFLKLGTTSLVLAALEAEHRAGRRILPDLALADPVAAVRTISHDPSLRATVPLADGRELTALEIQRAHLEALSTAADAADEETAQVLRAWGEILDLLAEDPMRAASRVEWVAKLSLLERYRARHGLDWSDPRLGMVDLQYSDLRPGKGLFDRLRAAGAVATLVGADEVEAAITTAPASTRAHLRGGLISAHGAHVPSAGWDAITVAGPTGGHRRAWRTRAWAAPNGAPATASTPTPTSTTCSTRRAGPSPHPDPPAPLKEDAMSQQSLNAPGGGPDENAPDDETLTGGQTFASVQGTDDLLDEIDSVLESNAETFVRSFVQKGGQ
ncbi:depupylase/deamidase Dop [Brachybacterium sp. GPGPB12]